MRTHPLEFTFIAGYFINWIVRKHSSGILIATAGCQRLQRVATLLQQRHCSQLAKSSSMR